MLTQVLVLGSVAKPSLVSFMREIALDYRPIFLNKFVLFCVEKLLIGFAWSYIFFSF